MAMLAACAVEKPVGPVASSSRQVSVQAGTPMSTIGQEAVSQINSWYGRRDVNCGGATSPAFLCSGVMLRATETNPAFLPWDPSPGSVARGGVPFSWLRTDTNFSNLVFAYRNGFIFYPQQATPPGKNDSIQVLCAFPMDADTGNRPGLQGCGPNTASPSTSGPCEEQAITTAAQWLVHFGKQTNKYSGQCGWSVRQGEASTADRFYQSILARHDMPATWWKIQNELILATWPQGQGASLPIRAFFYVPGNAGALENARNDQSRLSKGFGVSVPIVRMNLPTSLAGQAVFAYSDADQGPDFDGGTEPPHPAAWTEDFEGVDPTGDVAVIETALVRIENQEGRPSLSISRGSMSPVMSGHYVVVDPTTTVMMHLVKPTKRVTFAYHSSYENSPFYIRCLHSDYSLGSRVEPEPREGHVTCEGLGRPIEYVQLQPGVHIFSIDTLKGD
jgi:hypothetical protein